MTPTILPTVSDADLAALVAHRARWDRANGTTGGDPPEEFGLLRRDDPPDPVAPVEHDEEDPR